MPAKSERGHQYISCRCLEKSKVGLLLANIWHVWESSKVFLAQERFISFASIALVEDSLSDFTRCGTTMIASSLPSNHKLSIQESLQHLTCALMYSCLFQPLDQHTQHSIFDKQLRLCSGTQKVATCQDKYQSGSDLCDLMWKHSFLRIHLQVTSECGTIGTEEIIASQCQPSLNEVTNTSAVDV